MVQEIQDRVIGGQMLALVSACLFFDDLTDSSA
jgi:hypothetical protein